MKCSVLSILGCKTQRNEAGELSVDYLIKWQGLPYSCCTEEDGLLIDRLFPKAVDEYNSRLRSACTPNKLCRVWFKTYCSNNVFKYLITILGI